MPSQTPDPERRFGALLNELSHLLRREFERRLRRQKIALTRAQWRILRRVADREGCSQRELAEVMRLKAATVGRHVARLRAGGWLSRADHPRDGRAYRLRTRPKERRTLAVMQRVAARLQEEYFAGLPPGRSDGLIDDLLRIKENLLALEDGARNPSAR